MTIDKGTAVQIVDVQRQRISRRIGNRGSADFVKFALGILKRLLRRSRVFSIVKRIDTLKGRVILDLLTQQQHIYRRPIVRDVILVCVLDDLVLVRHLDG